MKLRNKKTGKVIEWSNNTYGVFPNTLAELNEEWEDYEDPKEYWYIEPNGVVARIDEWECCTDYDIEIMKQLGNYFESKEEAEKAVEKLKAWNRLKNKGFRFTDWYQPDGESAIVTQTNINLHDVDFMISNKDLDLLFGGEE